MAAAEPEPVTVGALWRQFLPLSLSDVTMMAGDPIVTTTIAHLPDARANLAGLGVAKAIVVFFESPVIMLLHASNVLGGAAASRQAVKRFMQIAIGALTAGLALLALPVVFMPFVRGAFGADPTVAARAQLILGALVLWPAAIGWRRYHQGILIRHGHGATIGRAGLFRLAVLVAALAIGFAAGWPGATLAATAMILGVLAEAAWVTLAARRARIEGADAEAAGVASEVATEPTDVAGVWRFYRPLATSMLVVWGGRAALLGIIGRAADAPIALAAWPAAWGFVLLVANATRMVQQLVIRHAATTARRVLWTFAASVGAAFSAILAAVALTPVGQGLLTAFLGGDAALLGGAYPVIAICMVAPVLITTQNAAQGFLMAAGRTERINHATWMGTFALLAGASGAIAAGASGTIAAAGAMMAALALEAAVLVGASHDRSAEPLALQAG